MEQSLRGRETARRELSVAGGDAVGGDLQVFDQPLEGGARIGHPGQRLSAIRTSAPA